MRHILDRLGGSQQSSLWNRTLFLSGPWQPGLRVTSVSKAITTWGSEREAMSEPESRLMPHYEELRGYFKRRIVNPQEVNDLTQETYLRVYGRKQGESIKEPLRLLYRVARNLLIDRSRRAKTRPEISSLDQHGDLDHGAASPARMAEVQDELSVLRSAIAALPERCQEVFILSRFEGLSYAEIAERLKISPKTVENHMGRAILACRAALERAD